MYICLCAAVDEKQVNELKEQGYTYSEIIEILNIGKDCGTCVNS